MSRDENHAGPVPFAGRRLRPWSRRSGQHPRATYATYPALTPRCDRSCRKAPPEKLIFNENDWNGLLLSFGAYHEPHDRGSGLAAVKLGLDRRPTIELVVHWTNLELRSVASVEGNLSFKKLLNLDDGHEVYAAGSPVGETNPVETVN